MDPTTFKTPQRKFTFLDSTAFPGIGPNLTDTPQLQYLNITPINFDRTNPNLVTLHELNQVSREVPMRSSRPTGENTARQNIDTIALSTSDIDSLADRVQSLLQKSAKFSLFDNAASLPKSHSAKEESALRTTKDQSSLNLLSNVITSSKDIDFTLPTVPNVSDFLKSSDKNNIFSDSNGDQSNSPISFSTIFNPVGKSNSSDNNENPDEVHGFPPQKHNELFISQKVINSKSIEDRSRSLSTNPESIMLEADKILLRIHSLMSKAKPTHHSGSVSSSNGSVVTSPTSHSIKPLSTVTQTQASRSSPIPTAAHQRELISDDDSDLATEYYQPPSEHNLASFNQTFNSHIYTGKVNQDKLRQSNQRESITPSSSPDRHSSHSTASNLSFVPNRTILEEEENCLGQMQKDTSDLRQLHKDLLQFERDYLKQQEKRRNKKLSTQPTSNKSTKSQPDIAASERHSNGKPKAAKESYTRTVSNEQRPPTQSRPLPVDLGRKSSSSQAIPSAITNDNKLENKQKTNRYSNPRHVRFDHQNIAHQIEQIEADCHSIRPKWNTTPDQDKTEPCECCLRHMQMNRHSGNQHLDCMQLDRMQLDDDFSRRSKTANGRIAEEQQYNIGSHFNKSVQTSFIMNDGDLYVNSQQTRPKSFVDGNYSLDCGYRGDRPGSIPRTPPPHSNSALSMKPLGFFVALNGNEPKKKANKAQSNKKNLPGQRENDPNKNVPKARPTSSIMPVASQALQDAFDRNMNQFKLRSLMRVRKIKDNEELRIQTAEQRREEITQTYLLKKQIESDHQLSSKPTGDEHNHLATKTKSRPAKKKASGSQEGITRPLPLMTRRVFTHREMRAQTEKVYRKLPEVKAQTVSVKREDDARRRRIMADIFKQRLKENAIQGKLNWPITSQAITS